MHIHGGGSPTTRLRYTALRVMGIDVQTVGNKSNTTSKEVGEMLVYRITARKKQGSQKPLSAGWETRPSLVVLSKHLGRATV